MCAGEYTDARRGQLALSLSLLTLPMLPHSSAFWPSSWSTLCGLPTLWLSNSSKSRAGGLRSHQGLASPQSTGDSGTSDPPSRIQLRIQAIQIRHRRTLCRRCWPSSLSLSQQLVRRLVILGILFVLSLSLYLSSKRTHSSKICVRFGSLLWLSLYVALLQESS